MKVLVVYYSMSGNTEYVAREIVNRTKADSLRLYPVKAYPDSGAKKFLWGGKSAVMGETPKLQPYVFDAEKYDTIVFGYPVWASTFAPPIRTFISENKEKLRGKKIAVFACSMGGGAAKSVEKLKKLAEVKMLRAQLSLIDPKTKKSDDNLAKIKEFCAAL